MGLLVPLFVLLLQPLLVGSQETDLFEAAVQFHKVMLGSDVPKLEDGGVTAILVPAFH